MCSYAAAALAITAVAAGVSAYGQVQQGQAVSRQTAYQAGVARNNQIIAENRAKDALDRGRVAEQRQRMETASLIGRQRAALAANGVQVDTGSALDLTSDTAQLGELDALTIRSNAEREALGFRTYGVEYQAEAQLLGMQGRAALTSSRLGATSTALGGASSVSSKWYDYKSVGAL